MTGEIRDYTSVIPAKVDVAMDPVGIAPRRLTDFDPESVPPKVIKPGFLYP